MSYICTICEEQYTPSEGCDCHEILRDHAEQCAARAVQRGLWDAYDGTLGAHEWLVDHPVIIDDWREAHYDLAVRTPTARGLWKARWREVAIGLYVAINDFTVVCAWCGRCLHWGKSHELSHGVCKPCARELLGDPDFAFDTD